MADAGCCCCYCFRFSSQYCCSATSQDIASAILNDSETPVEVVIYLSIVVALVVAGKVYVKYRLTEEWSTRDIVVTATLAVAIGILWVGWTWIWNLLQGIPVIGIYLDNFLNGFWMIGGVLVAYIIRKPGCCTSRRDDCRDY